MEHFYQNLKKSEQNKISDLIRQQCSFSVKISKNESQIYAECSILKACGYGDTYAEALSNIGMFLDSFVSDFGELVKVDNNKS